MHDVRAVLPAHAPMRSRRRVPWIANGGLSLYGYTCRVGGPAAIRATSVNAQSTHCRFMLPGHGITVHGEVSAPEGSTVGWRYSDPASGEHYVSNCSVASLALSVRGRPSRGTPLDRASHTARSSKAPRDQRRVSSDSRDEPVCTSTSMSASTISGSRTEPPAATVSIAPMSSWWLRMRSVSR